MKSYHPIFIISLLLFTILLITSTTNGLILAKKAFLAGAALGGVKGLITGKALGAYGGYKLGYGSGSYGGGGYYGGGGGGYYGGLGHGYGGGYHHAAEVPVSVTKIITVPGFIKSYGDHYGGGGCWDCGHHL
ncbi:neuropeptide-like protein 31 [Condylostylus longicornis]|uniref:neuropeptide-like protein 31 n=1 Tax=Condylostylus longicornis TaxID=2530218 RepID=UPI00244DE345|nr:neuropeptide-like protein 31 [Condylostylus longicornis]